MNVDYKIFTKLVANRMSPFMNKLVDRDQTGFIKGCYIGENLLNLTSVIEYCELEKINAIIISFDFRKAFDRVEWDVVDQVLVF